MFIFYEKNSFGPKTILLTYITKSFFVLCLFFFFPLFSFTRIFSSLCGNLRDSLNIYSRLEGKRNRKKILCCFRRRVKMRGKQAKKKRGESGAHAGKWQISNAWRQRKFFFSRILDETWETKKLLKDLWGNFLAVEKFCGEILCKFVEIYEVRF